MPKPRKYTEAQKQSARKWDAANLDRMSVAAPKGQKEAIQSAAAAAGMSANAYILEAVREKMSRDAPQSVSNASEGDSGGGGIHVPGTAESASDGE